MPSSCRIKKCFDIGMRSDLIRSPSFVTQMSAPDILRDAESRFWSAKRSDAPSWPPPTLLAYLQSAVQKRNGVGSDQIIPARGDANQISQTLKPEGNWRQKLNTQQLLPSFINTLDLEEETKLYELLYQCNPLASVIELGNSFCNHDTVFENCNESTAPENCDDIPFYRFLQDALYNVMLNAQKMKCFFFLDMNTRMNTLKNVTLQIFILNMISKYSEINRSIEFTCQTSISQKVFVTLGVETLKSLNDTFHYNFLNLINSLDAINWRHDCVIMSLLSAVILYDPSFVASESSTPASTASSPSASNSSASIFSPSSEIKITNERAIYIKILKKYTNYQTLNGRQVREDEINMALFQTLFGLKNLGAILESVDLSQQTLILDIKMK